MARRGRGFWTGLATGLAIGAGALVAWALVAPLPTAPPALDEATLAPPDLPPGPPSAQRPEAPDGRGREGPGAVIAPAPPGPLVEIPRVAPPPDDLPMRAVPSVDPFAGAGTGSPSLVPGAPDQP